MRPRHKAAENLRTQRRLTVVQVASMRPRHKAAENSQSGTVLNQYARRLQ